MLFSSKTPKPQSFVVPENMDDGYVEKAERLGIVVRKRSDTALLGVLSVCAPHGLYNYQTVMRYLDNNKPMPLIKPGPAISTRVHTVWSPLREDDLEALSSLLNNKLPYHNKRDWIVYNFNFQTYNVNENPIPIPVLDTIEKVIDKAKEAGIKPMFLVSDYVFEFVPKRLPDPFLMVSTQDRVWDVRSRYIIERWDEPGFRS